MFDGKGERDRRLLVRWCAGDACAGGQLCEIYREPLARFFRARTSLAVDDLVQDTFTALLTAATRYRGEASVRTFVFEVARRVLLAAKRRHRSAHLLDLSADVERSESPPCGDVNSDLEVAIDRLDPDLERPLRLFYWDGLCTREIAAELRIAEGTVSSRLRRAREHLRMRLAPP